MASKPTMDEHLAESAGLELESCSSLPPPPETEDVTIDSLRLDDSCFYEKIDAVLMSYQDTMQTYMFEIKEQEGAVLEQMINLTRELNSHFYSIANGARGGEQEDSLASADKGQGHPNHEPDLEADQQAPQ